MFEQIDPSKKLNYLYAVVVSAVGTVFFTTAIIVESYLWPDFQVWLTHTFSHHWIGKSVLITAVFFISVVANIVAIKFRPQATVEKITQMTWSLFWFTVIGSVLLLCLNIYETFLVGK